jgi:hypothetical protein
MGKDQGAGLPIGSSTAGGRSMGSFGLAPTPPPISNGSLLNGWSKLMVCKFVTYIHFLANMRLNLLGQNGDDAIGLPPTNMQQLVKCPLCSEVTIHQTQINTCSSFQNFKDPRVLACFHSFCKGCLEKQLENNERIICPQCMGETQISASLGVDGLLSDYGLQNAVIQSMQANDEKTAESRKSSSKSPSPTNEANSDKTMLPPTCTGCKSGENATGNCGNLDIANNTYFSLLRRLQPKSVFALPNCPQIYALF